MFQMSSFPLICIKDHKVLLKAASWELGQLHSPGRLKRKIFWVQDAGGASSGAGGASSRATDEPCNYFMFQPRSNLSLKEPPVSPRTAAAAIAGAVRPRRLSRRAGLPHGARWAQALCMPTAQRPRLPPAPRRQAGLGNAVCYMETPADKQPQMSAWPRRSAVTHTCFCRQRVLTRKAWHRF